MSQIKHTFSTGKMNKDVDVRFVPNGEYRDAMNVQVRTTSEGDSGNVQNLQGNVSRGSGHNVVYSESLKTKVIANIADEKSDKSYYFMASPSFENFSNLNITSEVVFTNSILELDSNTLELTPVVVDRYAILQTRDEVFGELTTGPSTSTWNVMEVADGSKYRVGMWVEVLDIGGNNLLEDAQIVAIDGNTIKLSKYQTLNLGGTFVNLNGVVSFAPITTGLKFRFYHEGLLKFNLDTKITSINIIDNLLFWTDGVTEPKKINIDRCKEGTDASGLIHTKLVTKSPITGQLTEAVVQQEDISLNATIVNYIDVSQDLLEKHISVIRRAPLTSLSLEMDSRIEVQSINIADLQFISPILNDAALELVTSSNLSVGDEKWIVSPYNTDTEEFAWNALSETNYRSGDILTFTNDNNNEVTVVAKFISYLTGDPVGDTGSVSWQPYQQPDNGIIIEIISFNDQSQTLADGTESTFLNQYHNYTITLEEKEPLFELKLCRFGYRYKYEDGEYSSFSPFSEIAFIPGPFDYKPSKAYNMGMVNTVTDLVLTGFIPNAISTNGLKAEDVKSVDILYKTTDSPNVHVLKTIAKGKDHEWESQGLAEALGLEQGRLSVTSSMIHRTLPSDQILRSWDNVPRFAKAQEIIGNRLIYGNYTQGYDVKYPVDILTRLKSDDNAKPESPKKSIKSIRNYKVGIIFGDKYGRETPVFSSGHLFGKYFNDVQTLDIEVPKTFASMRNTFSVTQDWNSSTTGNNSPEEWMSYIKYYIKETTSEYYNLVLDRWYKANEEDNIWLSFNSADRNKIDQETYLILKNEHGTTEPVLEKARYKVIAIENEAPDFIKTEQRMMGEESLMGQDPDADDTASELFTNLNTTNTTAPDLLKTRTDLLIGTGILGEAQFNTHAETLKGLMIRFVGKLIDTNGVVNDEHYTSWISASNFSKEADGTRVYWDTALGLEVDMYQHFSTQDGGFGSYVLRYYIEFKRDIVKNKPEFDGKFFVKIEKDLLIEQKVQRLSSDSFTWDPVAAYQLAYINSQWYHPSTSGNKANYQWGQDASPDSWPNHFQYIDENGDKQVGSRGANFFALGCRAQSMYSDVGVDPVAINNGFATRSFWSGYHDDDQCPNKDNKVFIDSARAVKLNLEFVPSGGFTDDSIDSSELDSDDWWLTNDGGPVNNSPTGQLSYNYKPTGIDQGTTSDGTLGRIMLSSSFKASDPNADSCCYYNYDWHKEEAKEILQQMSNDGTHFQFSADTSCNGKPCVYRVIHINEAGDNVFERTKEHPWNYSAVPNWGGATSTPQYSVTTQWVADGPNVTDLVNYTGFYYLDSQSAENIAQPYGINTGWNQDGSNGLMSHPGHKICGNCDQGGNDADPSCTRFGFRVEFRKLDENNNITTSGIDISEWDPLGDTAHDGTEALTIQIVQKTLNPGGYETPDEEAAIWETEPKEDIDLDLYYEASQALPMRIGSNFDEYTKMFIPHKSVFSISRTSDAGVDQVRLGRPFISFQNANLVYSFGDKDKTKKGIVHSTHSSSDFNNSLLVKLNVGGINELGQFRTPYYYSDIVYGGTQELLSNYDNTTTPNFYGPRIGIGDNIHFHHSGGTVTSSKILNFFSDPQDETMFLPGQNFVQEDIAISAASSRFVPVERKVRQIRISNDADAPDRIAISTSNGFQNDVHVVATEFCDGNCSNGIPKGLFIKNWGSDPSINLDGIIYSQVRITDYSWMVVGQWYDVEIAKPTSYYEIDSDVWKYPVDLGWHNCYSYGNGLESDRIRDDFNAPQIDNGVKVSTTLVDYGEENRKTGLIYSGLYNSTSGVNDLNEFNMSQKITKDLNPSYSSIQRLRTRDNDIVVFTEDKVLKVLSNKDALFNADGNPQLTASDRVLGTAVPFVGDYGISKNPESLAWDQYRMYFTDKQRGAVLRLSADGLTPISNVGMKAWFRNNLKNYNSLLGTFDKVNGEYNLTMSSGESGKTISFNEASKGWVSFKSFIADSGLSVSGKYFTTKNNHIFEHYVDILGDDPNEEDYGRVINRNTFYPILSGSDNSFTSSNLSSYFTSSSIDVIFNDAPSSIKSFRSVNYEGSQSKVVKYDPAFVDYETDAAGNYLTGIEEGLYYNNKAISGWYADSFKTDLQSGKIPEFINKEGKWFNKIIGNKTTLSNLNTSEFSVQGLGQATNFLTPEIPARYISWGWTQDEYQVPFYNDVVTPVNNESLNSLENSNTIITLTLKTEGVPNGTVFRFWQRRIQDSSNIPPINVDLSTLILDQGIIISDSDLNSGLPLTELSPIENFGYYGTDSSWMIFNTTADEVPSYKIPAYLDSDGALVENSLHGGKGVIYNNEWSRSWKVRNGQGGVPPNDNVEFSFYIHPYDESGNATTDLPMEFDSDNGAGSIVDINLNPIKISKAKTVIWSNVINVGEVEPEVEIEVDEIINIIVPPDPDDTGCLCPDEVTYHPDCCQDDPPAESLLRVQDDPTQ